MGNNGASERTRLSGGHQRDVAFVALLRSGDPSAFGLLFDTWIDPVYDRISHRSFTTADVADLSARSFAATHQRLTQQTTSDPFRVVLSRSARQEAVAAADRRVDLHMPVGPYAEDRLVRGADAAGLAGDPAVAALLWQAADVLGDQARDVLDLRHRHDFSSEEIAAVMNLTPDAIDEILRKLPKGLTAVVRAMVVWRQGAPTHDELATVLAASDGFDTGTVRTIAEHQRSCESCRETGRLSVDPLAVFGAIPLAVAPVGFKEQAVDLLHEQDLPIDASVSYRAGVGTVVAAASTAVAEDAAPDVDRPEPTDDHHHPSAGLGVAALAGAAAVGHDAGIDTGIDTGSDSTPAPDSQSDSDAPADRGLPVYAGLIPASGSQLDAGSSADPAASAVADAPTAPDTDDESGSPWDPLVRTGSGAAYGAAAATGAAAFTATSAPTSAASSTPSPVASTSPMPSSDSPRLSPSPASDDVDGSRGNRKLLYIGIAAVALILLIGGFVLSQSGKKSDTSDLTAASNSSLTTVTTVAPTSSASIAPTTTGVPITGETIPPDPSTDSTVTPTTKVQTPTTAAPTTSTVKPTEPFPNFDGTTMSLSSTVLTSGVDQAITLTWHVVASKHVNVSISGPGGFSSTDMGGSSPLCPGSIDGGGVCTAPNGVYAYRLTAIDDLGRLVYSKTVQFTVKHL